MTLRSIVSKLVASIEFNFRLISSLFIFERISRTTPLLFMVQNFFLLICLHLVCSFWRRQWHKCYFNLLFQIYILLMNQQGDLQLVNWKSINIFGFFNWANYIVELYRHWANYFLNNGNILLSFTMNSHFICDRQRPREIICSQFTILHTQSLKLTSEWLKMHSIFLHCSLILLFHGIPYLLEVLFQRMVYRIERSIAWKR